LFLLCLNYIHLSIKRLIKNTGAQRVSDSAEETLGKILEQWVEEVSIKAVALAKHAVRKTVYASDI
jgi:histone H3/H4